MVLCDLARGFRGRFRTSGAPYLEKPVSSGSCTSWAALSPLIGNSHIVKPNAEEPLLYFGLSVFGLRGAAAHREFSLISALHDAFAEFWSSCPPLKTMSGSL